MYPTCPSTSTVRWAIAVDGLSLDTLSQEQLATVQRIVGEPETIAVTSPD